MAGTIKKFACQKPGFLRQYFLQPADSGKKFADEGLDASRTVFMKLPAIVLR